MAPFVHDEIANDVINGMRQKFPIHQHTLDRLGNMAQAFSPSPVLCFEIANLSGRGRIAPPQLREHRIF
jgi:hypothetical protein